jgi:hypothetical protein
MVIYLTPQLDEATALDTQRLTQQRADVHVLILREERTVTVRHAVHMASGRHCEGLLVPDDTERHNELIEHAKACAHHMGVPVMPLSRYLTTMPAPGPGQQQAPGSANTTRTGVGCG